MNPNLIRLHTYPFEKLAQLKAQCSPPEHLEHIALSIGEPAHPSPEFALEAIKDNLAGLSSYPLTKGHASIRAAICKWLSLRYNLPSDHLNADKHVLPVNGTREALFSIAHTLINPSFSPIVIMPNPFYQIYEGAALLAGAEPYFLNLTQETGFLPDIDSVSDEDWHRCQLIYICSPGNPTGHVMPKQQLIKLVQLAQDFNFVIVSDECYSELYFDEAAPPPGLLEAAYESGNTSFKNCLVFNSLSKRSNLPGLRSGFVAGDERLIQAFYQYRTYHGSAMPLHHQAASVAAWSDEDHVHENRALYRAKFATVLDILDGVLDVEQPEAGFFLWAKTPIDDEIFTQKLYQEQNVTVLPGKYLSREINGINPGDGRIRIALVANEACCHDAAQRIRRFIENS